MAERAISYPFRFTSVGSLETTTNIDKIWHDRIILLCLTQIGERVMLPNFGTQVPSSVFEGEFDAIELARNSVAEAFAKWMPELVFKNLSGELDPDSKDLNIRIVYNDPDGKENAVSLRTAIFTRYGDIITEVTNG